jgi:hypothetical protein
MSCVLSTCSTLDEERDVGSWDIASSIGIEMKIVSLVVRLLLIMYSDVKYNHRKNSYICSYSYSTYNRKDAGCCAKNSNCDAGEFHASNCFLILCIDYR